jgi:hypothetical protein
MEKREENEKRIVRKLAENHLTNCHGLRQAVTVFRNILDFALTTRKAHPDFTRGGL